ncbi:hypothetical protein BFP77_06345 [Maribacter sp. 4U21]|uniref:DUF7467 domain-containing protein n=1 Tax=Maribacter sp. 4U21 TaxID=1889779 RepID=UPI000C155155|nr:SdrD B-like domain-containing protein [Maribacter sp. 4U21]PIB29393.1 hypothetical protein BFP77_06345 [Maribacter sp. 4U21]
MKNLTTSKLRKGLYLLLLLLLQLMAIGTYASPSNEGGNVSYFVFYDDNKPDIKKTKFNELHGPRLPNGAFFTTGKIDLSTNSQNALNFLDNSFDMLSKKKKDNKGDEGCCDEIDGKPAQLTFTFLGGGCSVDNNSQDDKSECNGGIGTPERAQIRVIDKKDNELFNGNIALGDTFTFGDANDKLESVIYIYINGNQEVNEVHASCSAPLIPGERFGSLRLEGLLSDDGEVCNESDVPPIFAEDCCDEIDGKPSQLTFTFLGGGCAADGNTQDDKSECNGGVGTPVDAQIRVIDKKDNELFNGNVALNDTFTFGNPSDKLESVIFIYINGNQEVNEVHASCSAPLIPGERFGSLRLEGLLSDDGEVCNETANLPCEATIVNNGCEPAVLWRLISKNKWQEPAQSTIQPGQTYSFDVSDGHVWQVWNVKDDKQFGNDFVVNCDGSNNFSFTTPGCGGGEDCCDEVDGKPAELTFQFLGGGCASDDNTQSDKSDCNGGVGFPTNANIQVIDKKNNILFNGTVKLGDAFSFGDPGDKLESVLYLKVNGNQEVVEVHASCSAPLVTGERFGSFKLVSLTTDDGEVCGEIPPNCNLTVNAGPDIEFCENETISLTANVNGQNDCSTTGESLDPCEEKKENGKPRILTFDFLGGGCAADSGSQGDKGDCNGGVGTPPNANIRVVDKKGKVLFNGNVELGGSFTFGNANDKLESVTFIEINGKQEVIEFHTSCSAPITLGARFGSLRLKSMFTDENKTFTYNPGNSQVDYVWTTEDGNIIGDANQATITVDQSGTYIVVAKDCKDCEAEDEVVVNLLDKVVIGDFVWVDENENGLQDDGATGVNGVNATLFQADGTEITSTTTANNPDSGDAGYYEFEVCPDSGEYYIVFDNIPNGFEITEQNAGSDDSNGRTY